MSEEKSLIDRVGAKLIKLREDRDLTQEDAAKGAGVGRRSLGRWESADQLPTGKNLERLAKFYRVSPSWILR